MVGIVVDTRQAKRLVPLFGAGGILGAVIGGLLTPTLASWLGAENLLLIWAAGLVAAFMVGRALVGGAPQPAVVRRRTHKQKTRLLDEMQQGLRFVRGSSVMKWMSLAAVLLSVLFFSLYLPFSRAATERFSEADALAGFFGLFSAVTTGTALVSSLFLTNRLFARFGVTTLIVVLPLIYLAGFTILIVNVAFVVLVAIRFVQMVWISSIAGPAWESVINVVPPARRDQTRAFMNGGPAQAGTIIAGLILLIGVEALSAVQLYAIGLATAALTIFATWRARRSYSTALIDALRTGRPEVFPTLTDEEAFSGRLVDGAAVAVVVGGASDADVHVRRAAVEILGDLPSHESAPALHAALHDVDATVRATALRSLARTEDASAISELARGLSDPDPSVRLAAVRAVDILGDASSDSTDMIRKVLGDGDPVVRAAAASVILRSSPHEDALMVVRAMLVADDPESRVLAFEALEGSGSAETFDMSAHGLEDPSPPVRGAAARALAASDPARAVPLLVRALGDRDEGAQEAAAGAVGRVGPTALEPVIAALFDPELAEGALRALERLPVDSKQNVVRSYAREEAARAVADFDVSQMIDTGGDDGVGLLRDSLIDRARRQALNALRAAALLGDRASIRFAIGNLSSRDRVQVANALEALESLGEPTIIRPLLGLWEPPNPRSFPREAWLPQLLDDPDPWIRECAVLLRGSATEGAPMTEALTTLSDMERVLFLRKVPLFADLPPQDLKRIAAIAKERTYVDDETIAGQGEPGEELHIVVEGEVRVLRDGPGEAREMELARRKPGDVVGEMALITQEPRMASVVASGDVRTLRVGRKEFEGVLRERPDTAIAVIRVLSQRLIESAAPSGTPD
jgi:HEAT repeat protein/MFS family permease